MKVTTHGALSVISAFATGLGSSVGIDLPMEVTFGKEGAQNSAVVSDTLDYLNLKFGTEFSPKITIKSPIPRAAGFKSSSALTGAIVCGYLHNFEMSKGNAALLTAECSRANRTSITGALDDAYASVNGGLAMTDNTTNRVLYSHRVDESSCIIAWPKNVKRNTYKTASEDLTSLSPAIRALEPLVLKGDFRISMVLNGWIYGMRFGFNPEVVSYFYSMGASHCSQTGKGPGVFAFFDDASLEKEAFEEFNIEGYRIGRTKLSNRALKVEG